MRLSIAAHRGSRRPAQFGGSSQHILEHGTARLSDRLNRRQNYGFAASGNHQSMNDGPQRLAPIGRGAVEFPSESRTVEP